MASKNYPEPQGYTVINEAASQYLSRSQSIDFVGFLKDKLLVIQSIQRGITQSFFEAIKGRSPFSDQEWADYFNMSLKSLQRYHNDPKHVYKPIHSEKIIQLAEVMEEGRATFGNEDTFYRWLDTPSLALGGSKPKELLHNAYGQELVLAELNAINYGIFA